MLNIIKADLYRIIRSKGFYITIGLFIFLIILQGATGVKGNVGINSDALNSIDPEALEAVISIKQLTASEMSFFMLNTAQNLIYFFLPLICILAAFDFSSGAVKNAVCYGVSREKYYIAKLIIVSVCAFILSVINIIIPVLIGLIFNGAGSGFDSGAFFGAYFLQLLLMLALTGVGIFFVFTTKKTAAACGAYLAFCLVPSILILIMASISDKFKVLFDYEITNLIVTVASSSLQAGEIVRTILIGIGFLAASITGGILLFKRAEIK